MTSDSKKILIVEDDPLIARMYQKKLSQEGYEVKTVDNGESALANIVKDQPDLVLLDLMMPEMNGVETLKAIKSDDRIKDTKVVILTNLGDRPEDMTKAKDIGALEYLVKSQVSLKELTEKVKLILK